MSDRGPRRRLPIESSRPMVLFALVRIALTLAGVIAAAATGFPYDGQVAALLLGVALPWGLLNVYLARQRPDHALNPLIALGDFAVLGAVELVAPETYGAVRFLALAMLAIHAHFQGEGIGIAVALLAFGALVLPTAIRGADDEVHGDVLVFYEAAFAAAALVTVTLVGRFRTAESASRLRARQLTRRTLRSENEIRRKLSRSLHDGPVQELLGLSMTLAAADAAAKQGDAPRTTDLVREAREITDRNVQILRDEMLDLGPYAYDEISLEAALERCLPVWQRRFGISVRLEIEELELPSDLEGELFRITQEGVANAGRHGEAATVTVSVKSDDGDVVLAVRDDGKGFGDVDPLGAGEPGHIGLASIRERAEVMHGTLDIETGNEGSTLVVRVPLRR